MTRFARADWLGLALDLAAREGPEALTLERLCAAAGRTRGSFYHHFADHDAFVAALAEHWRKRDTTDVIAAVEARLAAGADAAAATHALNERVFALDPALEHAMRRLAETKPPAAEAVHAADRDRIAFLAALAERAVDASPGDARVLAEIEYAAFVGALLLWPRASRADRSRHEAVFREMAALYVASRRQPSAATPGSGLPSSHSRNAPPAVET